MTSKTALNIAGLCFASSTVASVQFAHFVVAAATCVIMFLLFICAAASGDVEQSPPTKPANGEVVGPTKRVP